MGRLREDLSLLSSLLHHFPDNVEPDDPHDLSLARDSAAVAARSVAALSSLLAAGGVAWSPEQRDQMASEFKRLFEHLVILMQISEAQQAKGVVKNIRITQSTLANVYNTSDRVSFLHNQNLRSAIQVLVRAAENRSSVSKDPEQRQELTEIAKDLLREGKFFSDWVDGSQRSSQVQDITKRTKGVPLERALDRFLRAVEVRILSEADFDYKYFDRYRFKSAIEDLEAASRKRDKDAVVAAAKEVAATLKEAEIMQTSDEAHQLKLEVSRLIKDAQSSLKGDDVVVDGSGALNQMEKVVEDEEQIKGKPLRGQLPSAIQSMAALLNSRAAQQAKPKERDGKSAYGSKHPEAPVAREEPHQANSASPGYGIIAQSKK